MRLEGVTKSQRFFSNIFVCVECQFLFKVYFVNIASLIRSHLEMAKSMSPCVFSQSYKVFFCTTWGCVGMTTRKFCQNNFVKIVCEKIFR